MDPTSLLRVPHKSPKPLDSSWGKIEENEALKRTCRVLRCLKPTHLSLPLSPAGRQQHRILWTPLQRSVMLDVKPCGSVLIINRNDDYVVLVIARRLEIVVSETLIIIGT